MKTKTKSNQRSTIKKEPKETKKNQQKDERPLPGDYPPGEDIMDPRNDMERVHVDPDNLSTSRKSSTELKEELLENSSTQPRRRNTESDLTKEDYEALGPKDLSLDMGEDEQLKHRTWPLDFAAKDLDVPGSELDDRNEMLGSEDEENNSYSLGGDEKDNLEDDPTRTY